MLSRDIQVGDVVLMKNDAVLIAVSIDPSDERPVALLNSRYELTRRTMRGTSSVYYDAAAIIGHVDSVPLTEDWPTAGEKFSEDGEYELLDGQLMFVLVAGDGHFFFDRTGWRWTLTERDMENTRFRRRIRSLQDALFPLS
ncbi:hypothetical protein GYB59_00685 [bacterium]|nr:hypothetical protein [bacterium]